MTTLDAFGILGAFGLGIYIFVDFVLPARGRAFWKELGRLCLMVVVVVICGLVSGQWFPAVVVMGVGVWGLNRKREKDAARGEQDKPRGY